MHSDGVDLDLRASCIIFVFYASEFLEIYITASQHHSILAFCLHGEKESPMSQCTATYSCSFFADSVLRTPSKGFIKFIKREP